MATPISETLTSSDASGTLDHCRPPAQWLSAFVKSRDPAAFERLTRQYGPMVYGVCRRVIGNHHDAEDAFQATFLALARNASSIGNPDGITVWLYRVAYRVALRIKMETAARKQKELSMHDVPEPAHTESPLWATLEPELDGELNKLPEIYRLPILLVDIAGISHRDAAQQIGCPEGTLASRLHRAHEVLADRLTRRGIIVTTATLGALLVQNVASAAVPASLITSTVVNAVAVGTTQSSLASTMFLKGLGSMKSKFQAVSLGKAALAVISTLGILTTGLTLLQSPSAAVHGEPQAAQAQLAPPFAEIAAMYRHNCTSIQSLRIEYQEETENLFDPEVMWNECEILPQAFEKLPTTVLVIDGDKIARTDSKRGKGVWEIDEYLRDKYPDKGRLGKPGSTAHNFTFQQILDEFPNVPFESQDVVLIYDGKRFRTVGNQWTKTGQVIDKPYLIYPIIPPSAGIGMFRHMSVPSYLDLMLYSTLGPKSAVEQESFDQQKVMGQFRLPYLLENADWSVAHERDVWDGSECLVIESSNGDRLWLDSKIGFAVRRWTQTVIPWDVHYSDFEKVTDDFYVPRKIVSLDYAPPTASAAYRGQPSVRRTKILLNIEVNQPIPNDTFRLTPPAGATVCDFSMEPLDRNGNRVDIGEIDRTNAQVIGLPSQIRYQQPADDADLKAAIERGKNKSAGQFVVTSPPQPVSATVDLTTPVANTPTTSGALHWFIIVNAAVLLLAMAYFVWRRSSL